jgi:hypothetical protein
MEMETPTLKQTHFYKTRMQSEPFKMFTANTVFKGPCFLITK